MLMNYLAASLGQVYKGRLKETGELVAVKVQRPFVLETVTIDLFIIRNLGLVLRRFPQVNIFFYLVKTDAQTIFESSPLNHN
jgi:predicted unusual protein kinase regulating ubiquinone biosynthesis (AarF/ABC1/UbiB family)